MEDVEIFCTKPGSEASCDLCMIEPRIAACKIAIAGDRLQPLVEIGQINRGLSFLDFA